MIPRIVRRRQALEDLANHVDYLRDNAGPDVAQRFVRAAQETFTYLAEKPGSGCPCEFESPRAKALLWWPIKGFKNHLVFFRHTRDGIEVVRVLHAAQNWQSIFQ